MTKSRSTTENLLETIWQNYRKQMYCAAYRVLNNHHDSEDAVQDALLGMAKNLRHIRTDDPGALRGYVLLATKNAALNILSRKRRVIEIPISELTLPGPDSTFEQAAASTEYRAMIATIDALDEKYREVLFLCCVHQLSAEEAAGVLHRKPGTVRQQLRRGKKLLKKEETEYHE